MSVFSPQTWNDVGIVAFLIIVAATLALSFKQGWLVSGFTYQAAEKSHQEIQRIWSMANEQLRERSEQDQSTIQLQASTIAEQKVMAELTEHIARSVREATEKMTP